MHWKQKKAIRNRPWHAHRYLTQGRLPRLVRPNSPLIEVLERIPPRLRAHSGPVRLDPSLGRRSPGGISVFRARCPSKTF